MAAGTRRQRSCVETTCVDWRVCVLLLVLLTANVVCSTTLDKSSVWGTYRPQVYFGIRAAEPHSFLSGLVWFAPHSSNAFTKARHECDEGDQIKGYGYTYHDGRSMAVQEIRDEENNYILETSWLKTVGAPTTDEAGSWAVRIRGRVIDEGKPASLSTIYYASLESTKVSFNPLFEQEKFIDGLPSRGDLLEDGRFFSALQASETLPGFTLRFKDTPGAPNKPARPSSADFNVEHEEEFLTSRTNWHYLGVRVPVEMTWRGKEIVQRDIGSSVQEAFSSYGGGGHQMPSPADLLTLKDGVQPLSNVVALQRTFSGNFSFDVFYDSDATPKAALLAGESFEVALDASKRAYEEKFEHAFPLSPRDRDQADVARELTSQIVGSVGYYYGQSIVDRSFTHDYDDISAEPQTAKPELTPPSELLTATPSRSKFPRGFYWDEGFHLAHIGAFDPSLSLDILRSWIDLIDEDGWVAREQILGEEARSRVPAEFQTQYPTYANPPTLAMIITDYIDKLEETHSNIFPLDAGAIGDDLDQASFDSSSSSSSSYIEDPIVARTFLTSIYPKLRTHYLWFRSTQRGQIKEWDRKARARNEGFRWRGRTKDHVLTSGLDDYPRAPVPHVGELHLDLHCWMGSFAEAMIKVARALGEDDDVEEYERSYKGIVSNVDDLHWNEEQRMFCDASVDGNDESFHVCHKGYISLFPLLTQILPADNAHVGSILDLMYDPKHLWSPFGLRSLSVQDKFYGQGENYWRGPIWMPINYLALRALKKKYARQPGPFQAQAAKIYDELRTNVVSNVLKEYKRTGYTWEQYHPQSGLGQRSHPFTGWTSMAAMILAEIY